MSTPIETEAAVGVNVSLYPGHLRAVEEYGAELRARGIVRGAQTRSATLQRIIEDWQRLRAVERDAAAVVDLSEGALAAFPPRPARLTTVAAVRDAWARGLLTDEEAWLFGELALRQQGAAEEPEPAPPVA